MACGLTQVDQLRLKLQEMTQDSDPYPFLSVVEDYLAAVPGDHPMRAAAISGLAKKGLLSVAAELGEACPATCPEAIELRTAAAQLARAPSEVVDWSTTDARFAANLESLRSRGQPGWTLAEDIEQAWREVADDLTLHQANDGNLQVRGTRSDGRRGWIPAALDYAGKIEVSGDAESFKGQLLAPFLLDGVGMGWLLGRLHAATKCTYLSYSPAIYVVETNLRALALVLRLHDWAAVLADERVYLFTGPSAWADWRDLMKTDCSLPLPPEVIQMTRWPGQSPGPAEERLAEVAEHRGALLAGLRNQVEEVYARRNAAYWADRYANAGPEVPLRVLCITSRFSTFLQHSIRDLMAALDRAGCATRLLIEQKDHTMVARHAYVEPFAEFQPDLVLMIDHHRHEQADVFIENVPYVCWIQDELPWLFDASAGRGLGPLDFAMGFGLTQCVLRYGYPADRFMPCRLAMDPAKFAPAPDAGEPDPALRCDVAYVSHHSEPPAALHDRVRKMACDDHARRLIDAFYEETRSLFASSRFNAGYDLGRLLRQIEAKTGFVPNHPELREKLMGLFVRPLADRWLRHTALAWVADWADATGRTLHLYGNGWDQHRRFARYARGPAEHGRHLAEITRQAKINLHAGLNTALHQRVLETLCAGGFLMVRYHPHDFFPESNRSLVRYVQERGIDRPMRIPLDQVPPECVETMRERAAVTGREMPGTYDITEEWLLTARARRRHGGRYDFASLAFPDFERIAFDGAESFARRAEHFIENPDERQALAGRMQEAVNELFTYDALVPRVVNFIRQALRSNGEG